MPYKQPPKEHQFKPGESGNPAGKPKGVKNWNTIFEKAIRKIAKEKNIKECDVEIDLVIRAIAEARGGNYNYYKDIFDRAYGKSTESIKLEGQMKLEKVIVEIVKPKKDGDNKN